MNTQRLVLVQDEPAPDILGRVLTADQMAFHQDLFLESAQIVHGLREGALICGRPSIAGRITSSDFVRSGFFAQPGKAMPGRFARAARGWTLRSGRGALRGHRTAPPK